MRKGFISSCVRGRQLQSRDREAVIPTRGDFDWLLCQMTGFMRTQILAVAASLWLAEHLQGAGRTAENFAAASTDAPNKPGWFRC